METNGPETRVIIRALLFLFAVSLGLTVDRSPACWCALCWAGLLLLMLTVRGEVETGEAECPAPANQIWTITLPLPTSRQPVHAQHFGFLLDTHPTPTEMDSQFRTVWCVSTTGLNKKVDRVEGDFQLCQLVDDSASLLLEGHVVAAGSRQ